MINITVAAFYPYQSQYEALGELEREMNAVQPSVVDTFRTWRKYMFVHSNPCNRFGINFHIWKLVLVQCECNQGQIWKLTQLFSVERIAQSLHNSCCTD